MTAINFGIVASAALMWFFVLRHIPGRAGTASKVLVVLLAIAFIAMAATWQAAM